MMWHGMVWYGMVASTAATTRYGIHLQQDGMLMVVAPQATHRRSLSQDTHMVDHGFAVMVSRDTEGTAR